MKSILSAGYRDTYSNQCSSLSLSGDPLYGLASMRYITYMKRAIMSRAIVSSRKFIAAFLALIFASFSPRGLFFSASYLACSSSQYFLFLSFASFEKGLGSSGSRYPMLLSFRGGAADRVYHDDYCWNYDGPEDPSAYQVSHVSFFFAILFLFYASHLWRFSIR